MKKLIRSCSAETLDVSEKDVVEMQKRLNSSDISLDSPIGGDNSATTKSTHLDLLEDDSQVSIDDLLVDEQTKYVFKLHLGEFKETLKERDLDVLENRVLAEDPMTLQEIGDKYQITRERARQLEANILKKLKDFIKSKGTLDIT
ncbi:MAG: sigma factor-like helix-turn-helix DNA-binding protein [Bdellovibrionota bacterium]